jgi:TRAP-type C4-dicarboxylate transport system permease large subunit
MIVLTVSVVLPSIQKAGIDTLWFGIFVIIVVEMAQVTPPVGFNLFVVEGITGESMMRIARASLPFFLLMIAAVAILMAFPQIVSLIPDSMTKG